MNSSTRSSVLTISSDGDLGDFVHKNRLQNYAQKSSMPIPLYQTVNEGYQHAPQFRSTVMVDGSTFRSNLTFSNRKAAEQYVAKLALEGLMLKIKQDGVPFIHEDSLFCKSILIEYAVKMKLENPIYNTTSQLEGYLPMFVSSVAFNGETYIGAPAKNKKVAEQKAARSTIMSILASSSTVTLMSAIIKSKGKLYPELHKGGDSASSPRALLMYKGSTSCNNNGKEVASDLMNEKLPVNASSASQFDNPAKAVSFSPEHMKTQEENIWHSSCEKVGSGTSMLNETMRQLDSQGTLLDKGRKRPNKDQGSNESKKTRTG